MKTYTLEQLLEYSEEKLIYLIENSESMQGEKEIKYWKDMINDGMKEEFKIQLFNTLLKEKIKLSLLDKKLKKELSVYKNLQNTLNDLQNIL